MADYRTALVRLVTPKAGRITCAIPEDVTVSLYGAPCHARVHGADSASRHLDATWRKYERDTLGDAAPKGRAARHGHMYRSPRDAERMTRERAAVGEIRAEALAAEEEEEA